MGPYSSMNFAQIAERFEPTSCIIYIAVDTTWTVKKCVKWQGSYIIKKIHTVRAKLMMTSLG